MKKNKGLIIVLMGGNSNEREVSLNSGNAVLKALKNKGLTCQSFDWYGNNLDKLWSYNIKKVFIALHGKGGEDGFIQKELEQRNINYTGSNATTSKNCMDKSITKEICLTHNLPVIESIILNKNCNIPDINFPLPWAVKPTTQGSSIGISKVCRKSEINKALSMAFSYDNNIIIEQWIIAKEYSVSILKEQILPVVEIVTPNGFYDYNAKYINNDTKYICPAVLSNGILNNLIKITKKISKIMQIKDWARVDFIIKDDSTYILEVNTVPGLTTHSIVPMAAKECGIDFDDLIVKILNG